MGLVGDSVESVCGTQHCPAQGKRSVGFRVAAGTRSSRQDRAASVKKRAFIPLFICIAVRGHKVRVFLDLAE